MAITVVKPATLPRASKTAVPFGQFKIEVRDVTFDDSYPTGGEALSAASFGMSTLYFAIAKVKVAGTGSVTAVHYDETTNKLLAYTAAAQVANTTDLSAVTARVIAFGV